MFGDLFGSSPSRSDKQLDQDAIIEYQTEFGSWLQHSVVSNQPMIVASALQRALTLNHVRKRVRAVGKDTGRLIDLLTR